MPGVQINQLPRAMTLVGNEAFPFQDQDDGIIAGQTKQISANVLAAALAAVSGALQAGKSISPVSLAGGLTSDWSPTGLNTGISVLRAASVASAPYSLDGIVAPATSQFLILINTNPAGGILTLVDETASASLPANRFALAGAANIGILWKGSAFLWYDTVSQRWRYI